MNRPLVTTGARLQRCWLFCLGILGGLALSLASTPLAAQTWLEARLLQGDNRYVGQEQVLQIDLLTPHWFRKAPQLEPLSVPALVVMTPASATPINIRRDGRQYSGLRFEYRLYPQQAGIFRLPTLKVTAWPATPGAVRSAAKAVQLTTPPLVFQAARLADDRSETPALVARELQLEQDFSVPQGALKPGMLLRREISLSVPDLPGHLIPALEFQAPLGDKLRLYQAPPRFKEQQNRGTLQGQRIEQHSYLLVAAGVVQIPPLRLRWWNSEREQWQLSELPGRKFEVAAGPQHSAVEESAAIVTPGYLIAFAVMAAILALGLYLIRKRRQNRGSEQLQAAKSLISKSEAGQWASVIRALYHWLDLKALTDSGPQKQIARIGDCSAALRPLLQRLVRLKYGRPASAQSPGCSAGVEVSAVDTAVEFAEGAEEKTQTLKDADATEYPIDFVALQQGLRREVCKRAAPAARPGPLPALYPHSGLNRPRRGSD